MRRSLCAAGSFVLLTNALASGTPTVGIEQLYRFDQLPRFRSGLKVGAITSYDRSGGNDDGFSGSYSYVRKEGDSLVLAELKGPGCITRMHTPTATNETLEFYLDGEATPTFSMPYRDYFTGERFPFVRPIVDWASGGAYSYLPITFGKSCKILLRAPRTQFYDINYVLFPDGVDVEKFDPKSLTDEALKSIREAWQSGINDDVVRYSVPAGSKVSKVRVEKTLMPGKSVAILDVKKGGRIAGLQLEPAHLFQGRSRDTLLRITWDGEKNPSICMPVGDFFGYAFGKPSMESAFIGSTGGVNYCRIPMPFARSAKVELVSTRQSGGGLPIRCTMTLSDMPLQPGEGRFYARWTRENPTVAGRPFTWLSAEGRGHIVGLSLQGQGKEPGIPVFFEGDDVTIADGEMTVHGTGSEDFFNGGWYALPGRWDRTRPLPLSGCLLYEESTGRTGGYRFFLNDAYAYERSIVQTIEHGGENNSVVTDYTGVAYYYSGRPSLEAIEDWSESRRAVVDPTVLRFSIHSNNPLDTFGLDGVHITRGGVRVGENVVGALSVTVDNPGAFAVAHIGFRTDFPSSGVYRVYGDFVRGPDGGIVRLSDGTRQLGPDVDLFSPSNTVADRVYLGEFAAKEGENAMFLHFVGKDPAAAKSGAHVRFLVCEKV